MKLKGFLSIILSLSLLLAPVKGQAILPLALIGGAIANTLFLGYMTHDVLTWDEQERKKQQAKHYLDSYVERVWGGYVFDYENIKRLPEYYKFAADRVLDFCRQQKLKSCGNPSAEQFFMSPVPRSRMRMAHVGLPQYNNVIYELSGDALLNDKPEIGYSLELISAIFNSNRDFQIEVQHNYQLVDASRALERLKSSLLESIATGEPYVSQKVKISLNAEDYVPLSHTENFLKNYLPNLLNRLVTSGVLQQLGGSLEDDLQMRVLMATHFAEDLPPISYVVPCNPLNLKRNPLIGVFAYLPACESFKIADLIQNGPAKIGAQRNKIYGSLKNATELVAISTGLLVAIGLTAVHYRIANKIPLIRAAPLPNPAEGEVLYNVARSLLDRSKNLPGGYVPSLSFGSLNLNRFVAMKFVTLGTRIVANGALYGSESAFMVTVGMSARSHYYAQIKIRDKADLLEIARFLRWLEERGKEIEDKKFDVAQFKLEAFSRARAAGVENFDFMKNGQKVPIPFKVK
jgi:hypothetical protein